MVEAWLMDDSDADQRLPHRREPNVPVSLEELEKLGVMHFKLDPTKYETDPELAALRERYGYSYSDVITVSKESLPNYEEKIKSFFQEHIHDDDEVRYALEGSGYFDVRDGSDRWIRILLEAGDLITLPAGIYHRFTLDDKNYIKAMRLFVGDPVWTPINRPADEHPARSKYLASLASTEGEDAAAAGAGSATA